MMLFRRILPTIAFLAILQLTSQARSGVAPLNQSVHVDLEARQATFSLTFDHSPDLTGMDTVGHQTDGFQVEINEAMKNSQSTTGQITSVVHGEEIHFNGMLPIRAGSPPAVDPHAGGWGAIIGTAPFSVSGDVVTFSAPLAQLGSSDGRFAYEVLTTHDGQIVGEAQAQAVPLPVALPIAGIILLMVIVIRWGTAQHMRVTFRAVRIVPK